MPRRDRDDEDDDVKAPTTRGRARDDDDDAAPAKGKGTTTAARAGGFPSMDDEDAIDVGLFGSGPARIKEAGYSPYDYQGTSRKPPVVFLVTYERGQGKERETYEQPYGIGKGWAIGKGGTMSHVGGQTQFPKSCNMMVHFTKPFKASLAKAGIDLPPSWPRDPSELAGLEVVLERVNQIERNIPQERGAPARSDDRGPRQILEIRKVESAPWASENGKPSRKAKAAPVIEEDFIDEAPAKSAKADPLLEDAIEAIIDVVEKARGPIKLDDLEESLEKVLKGVKQAPAIIDLAMAKRTLQLEKGWSYDGKFVDKA